MFRPLRVLAALLAASAVARADEFASFHENVLGTSMEIRLRADSAEAAERAEARALAEIDRLAKVFSGYDPSSAFSRWQAAPGAGPASLPAELVAVLAEAEAWRGRSGGAFDPRVQALTEVWTASARAGGPPEDSALADALGRMRPPAYRADPSAGTAERLSGCPLSLDAIAKGFIVDRAVGAALDPADGATGVLLAIGGDLRVAGDYARRIGLADPSSDSESAGPIARIDLRGRALASSGGYQRFITLEGRRYSHILDPRNGRPAEGVSGAWVVAERAADADALATALCVLPVEQGLELCRSVPGAGCLIVDAGGRQHRGGDWSRFEVARPRVVAASRRAAVADEWGDTHELDVEFTIQNPESGGRYRRPYVAVWVEDEEGVAVRTLALYVQTSGRGPGWIPDLRRWHKADRVRRLVSDVDLVETVARATRPPGKYTVTWDGKDDDGDPVKAGTYTVCIEAAREHGTYQIIREDVAVGGTKAYETKLKGNTEMASARIEYREKDKNGK
jgi:thiamine biosynthesis lipoprotein ApbE